MKHDQPCVCFDSSTAPSPPLRQWGYCRIDGNTGGDEREAMIDEYNREGSEKFIFLLSTR